MKTTISTSILFVHNVKSWHDLEERFTAKNCSWRVLHACGIDDAKRVLASEPVDVGVVDLRECTQLTCDDVSQRMTLIRSGNPNVTWLGVLSPEMLDTELASSLACNFADYLTDPLDPDELRILVTHVYRMSRIMARGRDDCAIADSEMVGTSPAMLKLFENIRKLAGSDAPVFISGESGTGKELAAGAIHERSRRKKGPFVAIDCGAVPPTLIHSELFGYEKGAFTGANQRKIGRIESAQGGTLLLDEIGNLPMDSQGYLLRFLQASTIQRVGGLQPIHVDVRVIAATHVNIEKLIKVGQFREDLYFRLNVVLLKIPPLRERAGDISVLANFFLNEFARDSQKSIKGYTPEAIKAMNRYDWPGNVRELINRVRRAIVMCDGRWITPASLDLPEPAIASASASPLVLDLATARLKAEKEAIHAALQIYNNSVSQASHALGVSRATLYRMMQRYGLDTHSDTDDAPAGESLEPERGLYVHHSTFQHERRRVVAPS